MDTEFSTIYVDLDALFDTRVAVLETFGTEAMEQAVVRGYYYRVYDEFEGISTEQFKERYLNRDASILKKALVTPVARLIHLFGKQTLSAYIGSPYQRQPKVVLNTFPYKLSLSDDRALIAGLRAVTKNLLDIEIIHHPLEQITPTHVRQTYASMVMYSYWEWLDVHSLNRNLVESKCQQVALIGPRLVKSKEAAKKLEGQDVFTAIETYTGLFIKLQLYPANVFCVDMDRLNELKNRPQ